MGTNYEKLLGHPSMGNLSTRGIWEVDSNIQYHKHWRNPHLLLRISTLKDYIMGMSALAIKNERAKERCELPDWRTWYSFLEKGDVYTEGQSSDLLLLFSGQEREGKDWRRRGRPLISGALRELSG